MREERTLFKSVLPVGLALLMLVQLMAPITSQTMTSEPVLSEDSTIDYTLPSNLDHGHDLAGQTIDLEGMTELLVRQDSSIDMWMSEVLVSGDSNNLSEPSVYLAENGSSYFCWMNDQGQVKMGVFTSEGSFSDSIIDTVNTSLGIIGCSVVVDESYRPLAIYGDGANLKMARLAFQGQVYTTSDVWLKRTILEDLFPDSMTLRITDDGNEFAVVRTTTGELWQVNNSGLRWYNSLLDNGPIGNEFELKIDQNGVANIAYTRAGEAVRLQIEGDQITEQILARDTSLHTAIGLDLDLNGLAQVATTSFDAGQTELSIFKSLEDQSTGRLSNEAMTSFALYPDVVEGAATYGDLNGDGFDDVVFTQPTASDGGLNNNGRVTILFGGNESLDSSAPVILSGTQTSEMFGNGVAIGEFLSNGNVQLLLSSPGFDNTSRADELNHGLLSLYEWNQTQFDLIWSATGNAEEMLGDDVSLIDDMNGDGHDDLIALQGNWTDGVKNGRLSVFEGTTDGLTWSHNISASTDGPYFGRSMSNGGDLNGDGYGDFVVSNSGEESSPTGYSALEVFYGSANGFSSSPDNSIQRLGQGTLLGTVVEIIDDINNDGMDELFVQELFAADADYLAGKVHLFMGNTTENFSEIADWTGQGNSNERLGWMFASAGDVNDDGFNDTFIGSSMGFTPSGQINLYLGSSSGFVSAVETIRTGGLGDHLGLIAIGGLDSNADGAIEFVYSTRNSTRGTNYGIDMITVSKQDFDTSQFTFDGEMSGLKLTTSDRGETAMMFSLNTSSTHSLVHLEHVDDGSPGGSWVTETLDTASSPFQFQFDVTPSGQPELVVLDDANGYVYHSTTSWAALHQEIRTFQDFGTYPASTIDANGDLHMVYSHNTIENLYYSTESSSGWSSSEILSDSNLTSSPSIWFEGADMHILYRDANLDKIEHLIKSGGIWSTDTELDYGMAVGNEHVALQLSNGTTLVATTVNNSGTYELQILDIDNDVSTTLRNLSDGTAELSMCMDTSNTIVILSLDSNGILVTHERNASTEVWANVSMQQLGYTNGYTDGYDLACTQHGSSLIFAVQAAVNALHERNSTGVWSSYGGQPSSAEGGAWDIVSSDSGILLMTTTTATDTLRVNTMHLDGRTEDRSTWSTHEMKNVYTNANFSANVDSNGTIVFGYFDSLDMDVEMLRLYSDSDRDLIFDRIDGMPDVGEQWEDSDMDGFGDNPTGPLSDDCPADAGISYFYIQGCDDYEHDGFADIIDACDTNAGRSVFDRFGCPDYDEDGWSNNDGDWIHGDRFQQNWKQSKDSDGDGVGDNYGVDCCDAIFGSSGTVEYSPGDKFPYNPSQYKDYDNDGFGDNETDIITGDFCPWHYGTSYRDRNGCPDSDGDGASDPSLIGGINWGVVQGADMWPADPTQWADTDGDGYGDNGTIGATNPDFFPYNIAAADDNDSDGYPDRWTSSYNGSNALGLVLDGCPGVYGTSTNPLPGCPDSDEDGWANTDDDFPLDPTQFLDSDGDGFGDNPSGNNADECPFQYGVVGGTDGDGCPLVNTDDEDGDGIYDDIDLCPNTPVFETADSDGCVDSQLDDDGDGISNADDVCPATDANADVDSAGCSDDQLTQDSDDDGIVDVDDLCPDSTLDVDANGCDENQRDSDGDGVVDGAPDECPDTQPGLPVDATGCVDEDALEQDLDGDGYLGEYTFDIDAETGLRINQQGDAFPLDETQWSDIDGDGFGDNSPGNNSDFCPTEFGTSYLDTLEIGCEDDGDGWADNWGRDKFPGDATQWDDSDGDGYGDNWGDPSWNASRDPAWPGEFVSDALTPDKCPESPTTNVDDEGCSKSERDTDQDGVNDLLDNCPEQPKGPDGYDDGCPLPKSETDDGSTMILGMTMPVFGGVLAGGIVVLLLLFVVIGRLRNRAYDYDDDDYDDDDFFDDEDDDDFLSSFQSKPMPARSTPKPSGGPSGGPPRSSGPPSRGPSGPKRDPPGSSGGPSSGPPSRGPPGGARPGPSNPVAKKSSIQGSESEEGEDSAPQKKVRRARIEVDMSLFEDWQADDRDAAVDWVIGELAAGEHERTLLMQLQGTGWSAQQSRAIYDMARNQQ
ncbi:MAG: Alpha-agarase [Euryarchaeota archaeon UBA443]|nr:MAG: Alpha-agarase [Euryarchaeota archaeon UBA443]